MKKIVTCLIILIYIRSYGQDINPVVDGRISVKIQKYDSTLAHVDSAVFQTVGAQAINAVSYSVPNNSYLVFTVEVISYNGKDLGGGTRKIYAINIGGVITISMRNMDGTGYAATNTISKSSWTVGSAGTSLVVKLTGVVGQTINWTVYVKPKGL